MKIVKGNMKKKLVKAEIEDRPKLSLPTERSEPSDRLLDYSILLFGPKKIGKSSLAAQFEDTLSFFTEPGGKALSIFQVPCKTWGDLREYTKLFIKDSRFSTGVIDIIDLAYDLCFNYVCKKMVIDHPSEENFGKGWRAIKDEFASWVIEILQCQKGVIFISHSKDVEFKSRRGDSYNKVTSSMSGQAAEIIQGLVDLWFYYSYEGKKRYLIIRGDEEVEAGCRLENHFLDLDGNPLNRIYMGNSATEGYKNLLAGFNNEFEGELENAVATKKKLIIKRK
jgi:AAA domain